MFSGLVRKKDESPTNEILTGCAKGRTYREFKNKSALGSPGMLISGR